MPFINHLGLVTECGDFLVAPRLAVNRMKYDTVISTVAHFRYTHSLMIRDFVYSLVRFFESMKV